MKVKREQEIRESVRNQIVGAIEADLDGGESLMKEAFEECRSNAELKIAYDEMRKIAKAIGEMP